MSSLLPRILVPALIVRAAGVAPTEPREPSEHAQVVGYLVIGFLVVMFVVVGLLIYRRLR